MNKPTTWLVGVAVVLSLLVTAGPVLIGLANAAIPLVIAVGVVAVVVRLVFFHTRDW